MMPRGEILQDVPICSCNFNLAISLINIQNKGKLTKHFSNWFSLFGNNCENLQYYSNNVRFRLN